MRLMVKLLLVGAAVASVAVSTWAAAAKAPAMIVASAAVFAAALIVVALITNQELQRQPAGAQAAHADVHNAALMALAYGWGAATLAGIYTLTSLRWQHGLQYAAGMAVIAVALAACSRALARIDSPLRQPLARRVMAWITILHAAAAATGVGFLLVSGKLSSIKADWAANIVFLVGGLTVLALSVLAAVTQQRCRPGANRQLAGAGDDG